MTDRCDKCGYLVCECPIIPGTVLRITAEDVEKFYKPVPYPFKDPVGPFTYELHGEQGGFVAYVESMKHWPDIIIWHGRYFLCLNDGNEYGETTDVAIIETPPPMGD